jgi:aldehyde dehydrogenase (NAD+)
MKIPDLISHQKTAFHQGVIRSYEKRVYYLETLRNMISRHEDELCDAVSKDFGKPYVEAYGSEIYTLLWEIDHHLKHLSKWMKPETPGSSILTFPSKSVIYKRPLGTVLIIGAWNYPLRLVLHPLVGAFSAGNTVVLKPSELASHTSALLAKLTGKYFESQVLSVVEGGKEEAEELLAQPFDKIFFTGSSRVGKIVMKAAAEQLIPVSLELGGKSPAVVHSDANPKVSARRIWWGKTMNAGQTCVAPDFVLIHESVKEEFLKESKRALSQFFRDDYVTGKTYTRIINEEHFDRLTGLLEQSRVIFGGTHNREPLFIEPTMIEADWDDEIMQEEIFGPLLPVVTYSRPGEMIARLADRPSPLALYLFTDREDLQQAVFDHVPFGGGCINDTMVHLGNPNIPFGGVGSSGMGAYHGIHSFETFSHKQSVMKKPFWPDPDLRYPPYDESGLKRIKKWFS